MSNNCSIFNFIFKIRYIFSTDIAIPLMFFASNSSHSDHVNKYQDGFFPFASCLRKSIKKCNLKKQSTMETLQPHLNHIPSTGINKANSE